MVATSASTRTHRCLLNWFDNMHALNSSCHHMPKTISRSRQQLACFTHWISGVLLVGASGFHGVVCLTGIFILYISDH